MTSNELTRRDFLCRSAVAGVALCGIGGISVTRAAGGGGGSGSALDIASRRELFVDDFLVESHAGTVLTGHQPQARDLAIVCDQPWEGNTSAYFTIFRDGEKFRMYYRASHSDEKLKKSVHPEFTCYAESRDGLEWQKPELGLIEFNGSRKNNIIWSGSGTHNFTPFEDANPASPADARYKALARGVVKVGGKNKSALDAFQSADGIRWKLMEKGVITDGAFDSQNLAFWDAARGEYRAYWRIFTGGVRAIRTATSKDFLHWDNQADLKYVDSPAEHLYTNAVRPYFRAPHVYVGFPTRFQPKTQQVEPVFMSSRDGVVFKRWKDALIPISAPKDRDGNRSNYMASGLLQLPGDEREMSVYATEAYYAGPGSRVRRFTFRTDGFVSVQATNEGMLLTRPLVFTGSKLSLNIACKGATRVEIQDAGGKAIPGFSLQECAAITGDDIERIVTWKDSQNVARIAGQPVRLRFAMKAADLYSMQFA